jgi:hypothetical protein
MLPACHCLGGGCCEVASAIVSVLHALHAGISFEAPRVARASRGRMSRTVVVTVVNVVIHVICAGVLSISVRFE